MVFNNNISRLANSPGSSSSSSDWSPSPLPPIETNAQHTIDGPDRLMGAPVASRLPSIAKMRSSRFR